MRLIELPRPKPTVRVPEPSRSEADETQLADFPTDIPVHPPVKRTPPASTDDPDFPAVSWNREPASREQSAGELADSEQSDAELADSEQSDAELVDSEPPEAEHADSEQPPPESG
jgi:hypothetical protein